MNDDIEIMNENLNKCKSLRISKWYILTSVISSRNFTALKQIKNRLYFGYKKMLKTENFEEIRDAVGCTDYNTYFNIIRGTGIDTVKLCQKKYSI